MINSLCKEYSFEKDGVTQSLLAKYMGCPRSFAIATHEWTNPSKFAMEVGTYGHKMIETKMADFKKHKMDKICTTEQVEQTKAYLQACIPAYFKHYEKEDGKYQVTPEHVFDTMIAGVRFRGKIDAILSSGKGHELLIKETKFKSRISEDDLDKCLSMDFQSLCYIVAVMLEQKKAPKQVVYDVIRYPAMKPGQKPKDIFESVTEGIRKEPDHWFKRWYTKFDEMEIMSFHGELIGKVIELKNRQAWYRNQCNCLKGFKCDYVGYCTTGKTDSLIKQKLFNELEK